MNCRAILSGEMHYPRIPREYWRARMQMARAMGLNAISTYVFWNRHEPSPGRYDFSGGNDVSEFVRTAQTEGLDVVLRPGPYVCAEWDFGGLPAWLLANEHVPVRSRDPRFMEPVRCWLRRLGSELAPLQRAYGGPIVAVQLENEYGAFGSDAAYLEELRDALTDSGFGCSPMYTIDQPGDLAKGSLRDLPMASTFAPGDPAKNLNAISALRPGAPPICGEFWAGWFDHWGEPRARLDDEEQARDLEWMLSQEALVNLYMFHGGTNFGFWNGANSGEKTPYQPTIASYDYEAALDEAGRPTRKYELFREVIQRVTGIAAPGVPAAPHVRDIPEFTLTESAALESALPEPVEYDEPPHMERLGQSFGYVLYRAEISGNSGGTLSLEEVRDYAVISIDGNVVAHLDRRLGGTAIEITLSGKRSTLEILVENGGRINYGPQLPFERKGLTRPVHLNGEAIRGWRVFPLPLEDVSSLRFVPDCAQAGPAFYRGSFELDEPADTFMDVSGLGKGCLWINGRNAGRFWNIGPQRSLYVPAPWLRRGKNEVVAFDLFERARPARICGRAER